MGVHARLPVRSWLARMCRGGTCLRRSDNLLETPKHCLWRRQSAMRMWIGALKIVERIAPNLGYIACGYLCWLLTSKGYYMSVEGLDVIFHIHSGTCSLSSLPVIQEDSQSGDEIWSILSSLAGWHIWKARCSHIIGGDTPSMMHGLEDIWSDTVNVLGCMGSSSKATK